MKKTIRGAIAIAATIGVGAWMLAVAAHRLDNTVELASTAACKRPVVTVDAGHGGFDGGAVAPDGTQEKEINLAVAMPLADILTVMGYDVVRTRDDDRGLEDDAQATVREKKVADMKRRLALFDAADFNVSIHQNMFGSAKYHGAQMFYAAANPLSKPLASSVREQVYARLQPDNTRELKSGSRDIYLLYKTTKPTVLVECGFLSNAAELERLKTPSYQRQTAFAVACGVMAYTRQYGQKGG